MKTYFISDGVHVKIGCSVDPAARVRSLQTAHARHLDLFMTIVGDYEAHYHALFAADRQQGEWFAWDDARTDLVFFVTTGRRRTHEDALIGLVPA